MLLQGPKYLSHASSAAPKGVRQQRAGVESREPRHRDTGCRNPVDIPALHRMNTPQFNFCSPHKLNTHTMCMLSRMTCFCNFIIMLAREVKAVKSWISSSKPKKNNEFYKQETDFLNLFLRNTVVLKTIQSRFQEMDK